MTLRYEHQWVFADQSDLPFCTSAGLSAHGAAGWRVVGVVSRPGLPERVLMEREVVVPVVPRKKAGAKR